MTRALDGGQAAPVRSPCRDAVSEPSPPDRGRIRSTTFGRSINATSEADFVLYVGASSKPCARRDRFIGYAVHGEQGSAKSTRARLFKLLVDPGRAPLRSAPRDERDLMIAASNSWVVSFDNLFCSQLAVRRALPD